MHCHFPGNITKEVYKKKIDTMSVSKIRLKKHIK